MTGWRDDAACLEVGGDGFFPNPGEKDIARRAIGVCRGCPVREPCLDEALHADERAGIWGGKTPTEREHLRRVRGITGSTRPTVEQVLRGLAETRAGFDID